MSGPEPRPPDGAQPQGTQASDSGAKPQAEVVETSHIPPSHSARRWILGLGVAGVALGATIGALLLLSGRPTPEALRYVPADAAVVAEIRADMPGDQLQKVGNLLAHFPGFRDQAILGDKIDEALQRLVGSATNGQVDYRTRVKPWLAGPAFVAVQPSEPAGQAGEIVIAATTDGTVSCDAVIVAGGGSEAYRGLSLILGPSGMACAMDGRYGLVGTPAGVRAAIDAHVDARAIDADDRYRAARAALAGDRLVTVYVSGAAAAALESLPGSSFAPLTEAVPDWLVAGIRAEDDALVVDAVSAPLPNPTTAATLRPFPPERPSALASLVPRTAIGFAEVQGAGASLYNLLAILRTEPSLAPTFEQLDPALDQLGGFDRLAGWVEEAGVVILPDEEELLGGVILSAADEATATARLEHVVTILRLASLTGNVELRDSTIEGTEVVTIVVEGAGAIIPPGDTPGAQPAGPLEISLAARGRVVIVGTGEDFVAAMLRVTPGNALADDPVWKRAESRGLGRAAIHAYGAVAPAIALAEAAMPPDALAAWQKDTKPYVEPFEAVILTASSTAAGERLRLVVTVRQP